MQLAGKSSGGGCAALSDGRVLLLVSFVYYTGNGSYIFANAIYNFAYSFYKLYRWGCTQVLAQGCIPSDPLPSSPLQLGTQ